MRILLPIVALLACTGLAHAQSASPAPPAACMKLADVEVQFAKDKTIYVELTAQSLLNVDAPDVGKIVVFDLNNQVKIAFEIKGCMAGPLMLGDSVKTAIGS